MTPRHVVVAFDFDATLTTGDSVIPFMRRFMSPARFVAALARRPIRSLRAAVGRDRDLMRSVATEIVFGGRAHDEVVRAALLHADDLIAGRLRTDTVDRLRWHREQGHRIVIVSASYDDYLVPVGRYLGVDHVLSTRLEVSAGRCTGQLDGPNCRGPEKVRRLEAWLGSVGLQREAVEMWAYGDSPGDREMLAWSDRAVWVREPLASVAPSP